MPGYACIHGDHDQWPLGFFSRILSQRPRLPADSGRVAQQPADRLRAAMCPSRSVRSAAGDRLCTGGRAKGYECLMVTCPRCGASRGDGDRFCADCGAPWGGARRVVSPSRRASRSARRAGMRWLEQRLGRLWLPVLVCLTAAGSGGAGGGAAGVLGAVLRRGGVHAIVGVAGSGGGPGAAVAVFRGGADGDRPLWGVVEKFIGDAVMAVWGTPAATEGDAERAVRAALDLVAAVAELGAEAGVPGLAARAGVVTGEVAVTLGAAQRGDGGGGCGEHRRPGAGGGGAGAGAHRWGHAAAGGAQSASPTLASTR